MTIRRILTAAAAPLLVVALGAGLAGCGDDSSAASSSTLGVKGATTTSTIPNITTSTKPKPSTTTSSIDVNSAFDSLTQQLAAAGSDPCKLRDLTNGLQGLTTVSSAATARKAVDFLVGFFNAIAGTPKTSAADSAALKSAATNLRSVASAANYDPKKILSAASGTLQNAGFTTAMNNFAQSAVSSCPATAASTTAAG